MNPSLTICASNTPPPRLHSLRHPPSPQLRYPSPIPTPQNTPHRFRPALPENSDGKSEEEAVKLLGTWNSPFSRRVELGLKIKGVPYELVEEDLSNKSSLLLKSNPVHRKIPVLIHNGNSVAESLVILEYLDETWTNNPLLPEGSYQRAMARFWAKFVDEKIIISAWKANTCKEEEREEAIMEASQQLKLLENELKGKDFYGGKSIGYLDIVAFVVGYWFTVMQEAMEVPHFITEDRFPVFCKWVQRLLQMDLVIDSIPSREKLSAHMRARRQASKSS